MKNKLWLLFSFLFVIAFSACYEGASYPTPIPVIVKTPIAVNVTVNTGEGTGGHEIQDEATPVGTPQPILDCIGDLITCVNDEFDTKTNLVVTNPTAVPTATPIPPVATATPQPTTTPRPTVTPQPTATPIPAVNTATPQPSSTPSNPAYETVQEEGIDLTPRRKLNFISPYTTCVDNEDDEVTDCTIVTPTPIPAVNTATPQPTATPAPTATPQSGGNPAYETVQEEGSDLTARRIINFIGAYITCVDNDPATDCTIVTPTPQPAPTLVPTATPIPAVNTATPQPTSTPSNPAYTTVQEEGSNLTARRIINFIGAYITCVDNNPATDCTIVTPTPQPAPTLVPTATPIPAVNTATPQPTSTPSNPAYTTVQEEGSNLTARRIINFIGAYITCVDNNPATDCTIVTPTPQPAPTLVPTATPIPAVNTATPQPTATPIPSGNSEYTEHQIIFYLNGDVATGTGIMRVPVTHSSVTIKDVFCIVNTAGTTSAIVVDVNKNGTTIFTTQASRPSISAGSNSDTSDAPDVTTATTNDYFTIDIDSADSGNTGADLTCSVRIRWAVDTSS